MIPELISDKPNVIDEHIYKISLMIHLQNMID